MKSLLTILLLINFSVFSQINDTLFVSKLNDLNWVKTFSSSKKFKAIQFEDGSILEVGEKMKLGSPSSINQSNQQTKGIFNNSNTKVNTFSYFMLGRLGNVIASGITYLPESFKGKEIEIEEIKIVRGNKKRSSEALLIFQNPGMDITILDLKAALEYGELINPKAKMTSDKALTELQKAKSKLDLELITKEEYEKIKKELIQYIK